MDISSIIVAIVSGIFSVLVIILQKSNNKVDVHIKEQNKFLAHSNQLTNKLVEDRRHLDILNRKMLKLILDTNLAILEGKKDVDAIDAAIKESIDLKSDLDAILVEIEELEKEKHMIEEVEEMIVSHQKAKSS
ncbi:MAG: hypothetical protein HDQ88_10230 [Clostridia bacterium]|nr:hypothetical protein [Clostridia bacterium]